MTETQIKEIYKKYAFDFQKISSDIIGGKITDNNASRIWDLYTEFLRYISNGQYDACVGVFNTLELSGYYVDYASLKRKETIDGIITSEDQAA